VQRTGEHKDGFVILTYQKVLRRRTWEKIDAQYKTKETITAKVVDRIKGGLVGMWAACAPSCRFAV